MDFRKLACALAMDGLMTRLILSEQMWVKLSPLLPAETGRRSRPAKSNRMMIEGILWRLRCGAPWRDMPEAFGPWSSVYNRFKRWSQAGIWQRVFSLIQGDVDNEWNFIDSTIVKAHQHASGEKKRHRPRNWRQSRRPNYQDPHGGG